ncbi:MAG: hypothetical protein EXR75_00720 [Myxococcales bacterium]|nr:hypothetical protein [Myxococcales bacterium]
MIASILKTAAIAALLAFGSGCGAAKHDALVGQLAQLERAVADLGAQNHAMTERLDVLESRGGRAESPASGPADAAGPVADRPALRVVRIMPDGQEEPGAGSAPGANLEPTAATPGGPAPSDAPRPVIRGDRAGTKVEQPPAPRADPRAARAVKTAN